LVSASPPAQVLFYFLSDFNNFAKSLYLAFLAAPEAFLGPLAPRFLNGFSHVLRFLPAEHRRRTAQQLVAAYSASFFEEAGYLASLLSNIKQLRWWGVHKRYLRGDCRARLP
jgi:hypothetical protein